MFKYRAFLTNECGFHFSAAHFYFILPDIFASMERHIMELNRLEDLNMVSESMIALLKNYPHWAFYGEMGAGKTTLIKSICRHLGYEGPTASPTFAIVNEYPLASGKRIFHFDFYRLRSEREALDIGLEDYLDSGDYCLMEWPEKILNLLPADCVNIKIVAKSQKERIISIEIP